MFINAWQKPDKEESLPFVDMATDSFPMPRWPTPIGIWAAIIDFGDYKNSPVDMKMRGKCIRFTEGVEAKNGIGILRIYFTHVWNVQRINSILTKGKHVHEWKIIRCLNYNYEIFYMHLSKSLPVNSLNAPWMKNYLTLCIYSFSPKVEV